MEYEKKAQGNAYVQNRTITRFVLIIFLILYTIGTKALNTNNRN